MANQQHLHKHVHIPAINIHVYTVHTTALHLLLISLNMRTGKVSVNVKI